MRKRSVQATKDRDKTGFGKSMVIDVSGLENVELFKPKGGKDKNAIDILPFIITQDWYSELRSKTGIATGLQPGFEDYKLEVPVHRRIGLNNDSFLCLQRAFGKRCPICEALREEYDKPDDEQSEDAIRALSPSWRCYYNVYDYNDPDKDIQIWPDASYFLFEKNFLEEAVDGEEYITFSDLQDGKTIEFKGKEKKFGKQEFVEAQSVEFEDRASPYEEAILDETLSLDALLIIPTYDEVSRVFLGLDEGDAAEDQVSDSGEKKEEAGEGEKVESGTEGECPAGGTFGRDCNELDDCQDCLEEIFDACSAWEEKEPEPEKEKKEKEKPTRRVRRSGSKGKKEDKKRTPRKRRN